MRIGVRITGCLRAGFVFLVSIYPDQAPVPDQLQAISLLSGNNVENQ